MYRPSVSFADKSNARARQMERISQPEVKKRVCENHLFSFWGNDQWGNAYARCVQGNRLNEDCKELEGGEK